MNAKQDTVIIRREPTGADLNAVAAVAAQTVLEIARMDGAIGPDAISLLYVQRIYAAIVARQIKPPRGKKTKPSKDRSHV